MYLKDHFTKLKSLFLILILSIFFSVNSRAQENYKITGKVFNQDRQAIANANVILKSAGNTTVSFTITDKNGYFSIQNLTVYPKFYIEITCLGFEKDTVGISIIPGRINEELVVVLKTAPISLQEVNIVAKASGIKVNNDTTTYKVSKFLTGNEEVVEDVLKKLPGVEVTENGKITYKGKSISKVLIEGDDLFNKNYQIGTKNIKSVILDEIQAIENYLENDKLSGLQNTNETVLNLKIKEDAKNKANLAVSMAYGFKDRYQTDNNIIGISKAFKYFLIGTANNIGSNPSPYDYFTLNNTSDESSGAKAYLPKLIDLDYNLPLLNPKRGNINQTIFTSGSTSLRPQKNLNITGNYSLYTDKLAAINNAFTVYNNLGGNIGYDENKTISKRPFMGAGLLNFTYDISDRSSIKVSSAAQLGKVKSSELVEANYGSFSGILNEEKNSFDNGFEYTNRLAKKAAFIFKANYISNSQPQIYLLDPGIATLNPLLKNNEQTVELKGNALYLNSSFILKHKYFRQTFEVEYINDNQEMNTFVLNDSANKNDLKNTANSLKIGSNNVFNFNKLQLSAKINYYSKIADLVTEDGNSINNKIDFIAPGLSLQYQLSKTNKLVASLGYDKFLPDLTDLYPNSVITDNKTLSSGNFAKNVLSKKTGIVSFLHSDLFNQFLYFFNFIYLDNKGAYGSQQNINVNYIINNRIVVPNTSNYVLTGNISKYLPFAKATIKYNASLGWYEFFNQTNNSAVIKNLAFDNNHLLDLKSGFDKWFNFETGIKYSFLKFKSLNIENENHNSKSYLNLIIKPAKKISFVINNEVYLNNIREPNFNDYYFLDLNFKYDLNSKTMIKVIGKNLSNNTQFNTQAISELYTSVKSYSLIPATLLFELSYRF